MHRIATSDSSHRFRPSTPRVSVLALALAGVLAGAGCGSASDDATGPGAPSGPDGGVQVDAGDVVNGPTVNVSPSDGERGILADAPLILTFSEPMDAASVEAAWSSASLPADKMVFSWNATGTILTVDASAVLEHAAGGVDVDVFTYEIELDTTAQAASGGELDTSFTSRFHTARDITMQLVRVDAGTGSYNGTATGTDIRVGDDAANGTWRGFISIDLSTLPTVIEVTSASVFARQTDVAGTPYTGLGKLQLVQIGPMSDIDLHAYQAIPMADFGTFSDSKAVANPGGDRKVDVTAAVTTDLAAGSATSSFRLEFEKAQDGLNDVDHVIFDRTSVRMDVRILAE